jgi:16S rRNA (adenine1518-N6/adenine1519-N6)-dimethyltransferase
VEYLFDVPPGCFNPPPKVMSGVIKLKRKNAKYEMRSEKIFFQLVKMAFNQRRKMLRNAVKAMFDETTLQDAIFNKRAEQLSVQDFAELTFKIK